MISCKEINDYIEYAETNPHKISEDNHLLVKNIVKPTLKRDDVFFDEKTYKQCINFCEKWFYPLFPYQKFIYAFIFMYYKDNPDIVVFKDIFQLMARGNGKDGMLMPLATFLLTPMYGVRNYHIDIVANSEQQAKDSFSVVHDMLESNEKVMKKMFDWNKEEVVNKYTGSILRYNTSNPKSKDGKRTGMIIFNELHSYEDHKQLNVFTSGLGKIKHARTWTITTNGHVREGPLDEKIDNAVQILNGEPNLTGMFPFLARIKDEEDVHKPMKKFLETGNRSDIDISSWIKSNPSLEYMPSLKEQVIQDYLKIKTTSSYKVEFYTKRMNMPMQNEEVAITSWENILKASYSDIELKKPRETPDLTSKDAVVGLDFASINDFASAGFLFKDGDEYIWRQKTWINSNGRHFNDIKFPFDNLGQEGFTDFEVVDTPTIDEKKIIDWIYQHTAKYRVHKIVVDSYQYGLIKSSLEEYGFDVETRDNPEGIVRMIRNPNAIQAQVAPFIERLFIIGDINIGNSAIMRWAINNTGMRQLKSGNFAYYKIEEKRRKNDPFMAMVHAFSVRDLLEQEEVYVLI